MIVHAICRWWFLTGKAQIRLNQNNKYHNTMFQNIALYQKFYSTNPENTQRTLSFFSFYPFEIHKYF